MLLESDLVVCSLCSNTVGSAYICKTCHHIDLIIFSAYSLHIILRISACFLHIFCIFCIVDIKFDVKNSGISCLALIFN